MKPHFDEKRSPDVSTDASTSGESRYDQEMGSSSAAPRHVDISIQNPGICCLPIGMDLDPARRVAAEAVGTFLLMFCICGIVASMELMGGQSGLLEYAATAALTVVVVVFSIGSISGAHVNPAVTIAFATFGHFPWSKVPLYIMAQSVGSVVATYVGNLVYGIKPEQMTTRPLQGCTAAFWVELIATFIVMFLAASLATESQRVGYLSGFVVGIAIGLAVLITGPVSGGSMNPARSLGPAIVSWKFDDIWIYIVAPTVGAVSGALLYRILRIPRRPTARIPTSSVSSPDPTTTLISHSIIH